MVWLNPHRLVPHSYWWLKSRQKYITLEKIPIWRKTGFLTPAPFALKRIKLDEFENKYENENSESRPE
jgi:hypothetical protein